MRSPGVRLILASASPRRDELLNTAGLSHEVIVSGADENVSEKDPCALVEQLSARKAMEVSGRIEEEGDFAVIGADTVVFLDGVILGKPEDREDAKRMLRTLSGRAHHVCTGVTLNGRIGGVKRVRTFSEVSTVHVDQLTERQGRRLWHSGRVLQTCDAHRGRLLQYRRASGQQSVPGTESVLQQLSSDGRNPKKAFCSF